MLRAPRTLMALLLLVVGVVAPAATSTAAGGACPDANGVTLVVDFRSLGGEMIVRCAVGEIDDGFHALRAAGIDHDQPVRFPGMVCRVEDLPADEPCQGAPPADRYWGYWHADHGGDWTYANKGPGGRTPAPGSAEGWAFFSTAAGDAEAMPPRMAPPTHAAAAASPTPTPTPSPTPDPDVVSPSPPAPTPSTGPTEPQPPATPSDQPIEPTPSPASTPAATPTPAASDPVATASPTTTPSTSATETASAAPSESVSATPADSPKPDDEPSTDPVSAPADDGGPSAATIVGILLILALAVAAGITARRRRTA